MVLFGTLFGSGMEIPFRPVDSLSQALMVFDLSFFTNEVQMERMYQKQRCSIIDLSHLTSHLLDLSQSSPSGFIRRKSESCCPHGNWTERERDLGASRRLQTGGYDSLQRETQLSCSPPFILSLLA